MTTKVTILCGVSTDSQASEDKASIPSQIETCREFIRRNGGREVGLFIMDGFSRFGYFNTEDAIRLIERQITKVQEGFKREIYSADQAQKEIAELRGKIETIRQEAENEERLKAARERIVNVKDELLSILQDLPHMLRERPAQQNNRFLRRIIKRVHVGNEIKIEWT